MASIGLLILILCAPAALGTVVARRTGSFMTSFGIAAGAALVLGLSVASATNDNIESSNLAALGGFALAAAASAIALLAIGIAVGLRRPDEPGREDPPWRVN